MCICANMHLYLYVFCVRRCVYIYLWIYVGVSSFDLFILMFFSFFFHLLYHNENTAFLPALCYPSLCWCYSYLSAIKLQSQLLYVNFQSVCLFVCFFFVSKFYSQSFGLNSWQNKTYFLTKDRNKLLNFAITLTSITDISKILLNFLLSNFMIKHFI